MGESSRYSWRFLAAALLVAAFCLGYLAFRAARGNRGAYQYHSASTEPVTQPATAPSTQPKPAPPTTQFIDVVHLAYPDYTATRPLPLPVRELTDAARVVLNEPVYLAQPSRADLWITLPEASAMPEVLNRAMDVKEYPQVHVVPERVKFVHWNLTGNTWVPVVICESDHGAPFAITPTRKRALPTGRRFDWDRAFSWNDKVVAPSENGVSIFHFEPELTEDFHTFELPKGQEQTPHGGALALLDWQGLIAWIPAEKGQPGSVGVARYVDGKWADLGAEQGWPAQLMQVVPLLDGSVLQMIVGENGSVRLSVATLGQADIDEGAVAALVNQMSDADPERRAKAFQELSQYGPGVYGVLERLAPDQPPEARNRIRSLLRGKVQPTLGGMSLLGDRLVPVTRDRDGGVVFFAEQGVAIPREQGEPLRITPAWIAIRPGHAAELLDDLMVKELKPDGCSILANGNDWIVAGDAAGPRRWIGNGFIKLLRPDESAFTQFRGVDRRGRWLFQTADTSRTLILDPTLPNPTPRLPVWEYKTAWAFGWDAHDWPAIRRNGGDWTLHEEGWKLLDASKGEQVLTAAPEEWGTTPGKDHASTWADIRRRARPLLVAADCTQYDDGLVTLRVTSVGKPPVTWPLPPAATGKGVPTLLQTADGTLYLFNQPGRLLRIRPTPDKPEPFAVEATFTQKIPSDRTPGRIWLDPSGRIIMTDTGRMLIFFPEGFVPPRLRDQMPLEGDDPAG